MKGFDIFMESVSNGPQIVAESKMMDESKTKNKKDSYRFSDSSLSIKWDVKKCTSDEAQIYVTVANLTGESINISDNLTYFRQYIKEKNLVFEKCLLDFDVIEDERKELKIKLKPGGEKQFSIHYKKPSEKVDFKELLEKKREGCVVTSEKTEQDEKNKNIEIASVEITNNGKFPFCVSKMKDYFRKKKPEKNYKFLKYIIEKDIENILGTEPDEVIKYENADILINPNSKVRICAIYSKLENKKASDGIKADVCCKFSDLGKKPEYKLTVSGPTELAGNLVKRKFTINNPNSSRLYVKAKADELKKHFEEGAIFSRFSGDSIVKKTNEEIELVVDPESTGSFEACFKEDPEDVYCNLIDLEGNPEYKLNFALSIKSGASLIKFFDIINNSKNRLYVIAKPDDFKKCFDEDFNFLKFSGQSIEKKPDNSVIVEVAPRSSDCRFAVTFRDMSEDLQCNLSELVDSGYCTILYHGKSEETGLVEREFVIKNPFGKALHITVDVNYLKRIFGENVQFSHIYEESEDGKNLYNETFDKVTFMVEQEDRLNFKVYFKVNSLDVYSELKYQNIKGSEKAKELEDNLFEKEFTIENKDYGTLHIMADVCHFKKDFPKNSNFAYLYEKRIGKKTDKKIELIVDWGDSITFKVYFRNGNSKDVYCRLGNLKGNNKYDVTVSEPYEDHDLVARTVMISNPHNTRTLYVTADVFYLKQQYFGKNDVFSHFRKSPNGEDIDSKRIELKVKPKSTFAFDVYFKKAPEDVY